MSDIEQKALALVNKMGIEECEEVNLAPHKTLCAALRLSVLEHEDTKQELDDFRQEVSDVVEQALSFGDVESLRRKGVLSRFIIPKPKPDPLVEVVADCGVDRFESWADQLSAALEARALEIREKGQ